MSQSAKERRVGLQDIGFRSGLFREGRANIDCQCPKCCSIQAAKSAVWSGNILFRQHHHEDLKPQPGSIFER